MESVNSLRISAPQWWPLREGRDGKCEGRNEKCEFLARESVSSSPIVRIFGKWKCEFIANRATMVTSLPSLSLSLCISLSLSPKVPHAQYRKRFRASYNITCKNLSTDYCDWTSIRWLAIVLQTIPDLSPLSSYGTATKPSQLQSCLVRWYQPDFSPVYKHMTKKVSRVEERILRKILAIYTDIIPLQAMFTSLVSKKIVRCQMNRINNNISI